LDRIVWSGWVLYYDYDVVECALSTLVERYKEENNVREPESLRVMVYGKVKMGVESFGLDLRDTD
jgi:hypothetical protein